MQTMSTGNVTQPSSISSIVPSNAVSNLTRTVNKKPKRAPKIGTGMPKLTVLSVDLCGSTNGSNVNVECKMENKMKTITFKFDANDAVADKIDMNKF